jgi:hypothetical protein
MTKEELIQKLDILKVSRDSYSLYGELNPGAIVLYENYNKWEVFLFDERGNREQERIFWSEEESLVYIYELIKDVKETGDKFGIKLV